jgi:hypothetical protein
MKDIYELLNDINMELEEFENTTVSNKEKEKLKSKLLSQVVIKNHPHKRKRTWLAAIVMIGFLSSSMIGLSFTAFAEEIPFLGNIFKFFNRDGIYDAYDENAEKLDLVQESNGITITVDDAVFDGKSLYITYSIETEKDLGENPWVNSLPAFDTPRGGLGGSTQVSKIDDNKYIGLYEVSHYDELQQEIHVIWNIESLSTEANNNGTVYQGNWRFDFDINAVEYDTKEINKTIDDQGITITLDKITVTPMSFLLYYNHIEFPEITREWDNITVEMDVVDNLGNHYLNGPIEGEGVHQYVDGEVVLVMNWVSTYEKLHPDATKLILTPKVNLSDNETIGYDGDGEPIKARYRLIDSLADEDELLLDDIIIDLEN